MGLHCCKTCTGETYYSSQTPHRPGGLYRSNRCCQKVIKYEVTVSLLTQIQPVLQKETVDGEMRR